MDAETTLGYRPGVHNAAIVAALVGGNPVLLLEDRHREPFIAMQQLARHRQTARARSLIPIKPLPFVLVLGSRPLHCTPGPLSVTSIINCSAVR